MCRADSQAEGREEAAVPQREGGRCLSALTVGGEAVPSHSRERSNNSPAPIGHREIAELCLADWYQLGLFLASGAICRPLTMAGGAFRLC